MLIVHYLLSTKDGILIKIRAWFLKLNYIQSCLYALSVICFLVSTGSLLLPWVLLSLHAFLLPYSLDFQGPLQ